MISQLLKEKGGYAYLAHPYDAFEDKKELLSDIKEIGHHYIRAGICIYSPVLTSLKVLPKDWDEDDRIQYDYPFLYSATTLILLPIKGWEQSKGMKQEVDWAKSHGIDIVTTSAFIPIDLISPVELPGYVIRKATITSLESKLF